MPHSWFQSSSESPEVLARTRTNTDIVLSCDQEAENKIVQIERFDFNQISPELPTCGSGCVHVDYTNPGLCLFHLERMRTPW